MCVDERYTRNKARVAILGSGSVGTDLMFKTLKDPQLLMGPLVGRRKESPGLAVANDLGVETTIEGLAYFEADPDGYDIVFDATSADSHLVHAPVLSALGATVVDLTPAKLGPYCVPAINLGDLTNQKNVNMVTCGGQATIPLIRAISDCCEEIEYVEIVSAISSDSAGQATRENIDKYITTTEDAIKQLSKARSAKTILNINPAVPQVVMQSTIFITAGRIDLDKVVDSAHKAAESVRAYVPGYEVAVEPRLRSTREVVLSVRVRGSGDYLPSHAGNLDIINCAAIAAAKALTQFEKSS
ncbi:acetaldehyde dehydrogenase (acetylating) [Salinisphaera hydrothermalis]|uniref:acetaldehyde dehydrogenase (acetylating) n=1 Tax=Salinisphaera hydrothermalis TaxID=563188 RepID=UPI00333F2071